MSIINKLPIENSAKYFKIRIDFDSDLGVEIITNNTAWKGIWSSEQIDNFCKDLKLDFTNYRMELKNVLASNSGLDNYSYSIGKDKLIIKKTVPNSKIKMKFAIIPLQQVDYPETAESFVELAIDLNKNIQNELQEKREENVTLLIEKSTLVDKLEKYKSLKEEIESTLYGKFLVLLNSKKDKIRLLEELLEARKGDTINSQESSNSSEIRVGRRRTAILNDVDTEQEDSDVDFQINSQDDSQVEIGLALPKRIRQNIDEAGSPAAIIECSKSSSKALLNVAEPPKPIEDDAEAEVRMEMDLNTEELFKDF